MLKRTPREMNRVLPEGRDALSHIGVSNNARKVARFASGGSKGLKRRKVATPRRACTATKGSVRVSAFLFFFVHARVPVHSHVLFMEQQSRGWCGATPSLPGCTHLLFISSPFRRSLAHHARLFRFALSAPPRGGADETRLQCNIWNVTYRYGRGRS